jgi:putative endonuclease
LLRRRPAETRGSTRSVGARAERAARLHYRVRGYRVLGANVHAGANEIDLIVRRGETVVFCEVKAKSGAGYGAPADMVDAEKQRRVRQAATRWLGTHPELARLAVRFDVVAVSGGRVERIRDAF